MATVQTILLAALQGLTEFLPISSSGHLILVPSLLGWSDQGLAFDIAVHVGTLIAVLVYFRSEVLALLRGWFASFTGVRSQEARLAWAILLATLPVVVAGLLLKDWIEGQARAPMLIAATTAGFGVLLWLADRFGGGDRDEFSLRPRDVAVIALAQVLALVPGTSRSGITITAGLAMGLSRRGAARFSFLLAIPVIAGAGTLLSLDLAASEVAVDWTALLTGAAVSAAVALASIHLFLGWVERIGMLPFAVYRVVLAAAVVAVLA